MKWILLFVCFAVGQVAAQRCQGTASCDACTRVVNASDSASFTCAWCISGSTGQSACVGRESTGVPRCSQVLPGSSPAPNCPAGPNCQIIPFCQNCTQAPGCGWCPGDGVCRKLTDLCMNPAGTNASRTCGQASPPCSVRSSCGTCFSQPGDPRQCGFCWHSFPNQTQGMCYDVTMNTCPGSPVLEISQCSVPADPSPTCEMRTGCGQCTRIFDGSNRRCQFCAGDQNERCVPEGVTCPASTVPFFIGQNCPVRCGERSPGECGNCVRPMTAANPYSCMWCSGGGNQPKCERSKDNQGQNAFCSLQGSIKYDTCPAPTSSTGVPEPPSCTYSNCAECAAYGCAWCQSSSGQGFCKSSASQCLAPSFAIQYRENCSIPATPCQIRRNCSDCVSVQNTPGLPPVYCAACIPEDLSVGNPYCIATTAEGAPRCNSGFVQYNRPGLAGPTCPLPNPCVNNQCPITTRCVPRDAETYECISKCQPNPCSVAPFTACSVDPVSGNVKCEYVPPPSSTGAPPPPPPECSSLTSCDTCTLPLPTASGVRLCDWCKANQRCQPRDAGQTTCPSTALAMQPGQCSADPCAPGSNPCTVDQFCRVSADQRPYCINKCDVVLCGPGNRCEVNNGEVNCVFANSTGGNPCLDFVCRDGGHCIVVNGQPVCDVNPRCYERRGCLDCTRDQQCGFCVGVLGAQCVALPTSATPNSATCAAGNILVRTPDTCPAEDPCRNYQCPTGQVCIPTAAGPLCKSPCERFFCNPPARCAVNGTQPYCHDPCASAGCTPTQVCIIDEYGSTSCADPCRNKCTGNSFCNSTSTPPRCQCPVGQELIPYTDSAGQTLFTCRPKSTISCSDRPDYCPPSFICVVRDQSLHCICPDGMIEIVDPVTQRKQCVPNPCHDGVCGPNEQCFPRVFARNDTVFVRPECICKPGYVRDASTLCVPVDACTPPRVRDNLGRCVQPCPDGSIPIDNRCPEICTGGAVLSPVDYAAVPFCGFWCPDRRTFVRNLRDCPCVRIAPQPAEYNGPYVLCECPQGTVRSTTFPFECKQPGQCTDCNTGCGLAGWVRDNGVCLYVCPPDSTNAGQRVDNPEKCFACPAGQCLDVASKRCSQLCNDGTCPWNGQCPKRCDESMSAYDCCILLGNSDCVRPCDFGYVRVRLPDGTTKCVKLCDDGSIPNADGLCPRDCPEGGFLVAGVCTWYCPDGRPVTVPPRPNNTICCPPPSRWDRQDKVCRCPDGTIARDGKCETKCDPNDPANRIVNSAGVVTYLCACPFPTRRNANGKCVCSDNTDPIDGGCPEKQCPDNLVLVPGSRECVCPDFTEPIQGRCRCNPAVNRECPITPFNCKGREKEFPPCRCVSEDINPETNKPWKEDPICRSGDIICPERCRANPWIPECFCILHPDADECQRPDKCRIKPELPECKRNCTRPGVDCRIEVWCRLNPTAPRCKCILNPQDCRYDVTPKPRDQCVNFDDKSDRRCYCSAHWDRFCLDNAGEQRPDVGDPNDPRTNTGAPSITPRTECAADRSNCPDQGTVSGDQTATDIRFRSLLNSAQDVNLDIKTEGPIIILTRGGSGTGEGSRFDARLMLWEVVEFIDVNDNCRPDDGDRVVSRIRLTDLTWRAVLKRDVDGTIFYTVSVSDSQGYFLFVFTMSADKYTVGTTTIPVGARMTMELNYPTQSSDSKLFLIFKIVIGSSLRLDAADVSAIKIYNGADTQVGTVSLDRFVRVGARGTINFNLALLGDTTAGDSTHLTIPSGGKVFTLAACYETTCPGKVVYDPVMAPTDFTAPPNSASARQPQAIIAAIVLALCAWLLRI